VANSPKSTSYEDVAEEFIARRGRNSSGIGVSTVAEWAQMLPSGATVLDVGCGVGVPISQVLIERGFKLYG
jgi:2-polyprenyl-3-methyl-5-hydroxy-6-metoxy-1,4-benzoquinol methylase